ncbi:hypothetical protein MUU72_16285 [Streptomyces sp. RS10V-4]|uniref:hypothetical protein n=1 Tax=Streptomyces rhizoryzae TaxID=2932493 RepID=UPI00200436CA|nr:hypothetical protein [Streptomyces rhizoryzae]MCK7624639.1 hypothetical protein [Streptomyces rhizoryzae]
MPEVQRRSALLYEDVVRPVCEHLGLTFLRADSLAEAGLPGDQLLRLLTEVDVVVADLSDPDAELSYGLGMRHALGRYTVHVTQGTGHFPGPGTPVPRIPFPSRADIVTVRQQLTGLLEEGMSGHSVPSLPVGTPPGPAAEPVAESDEDTPGMFDLLVEAEAQLEAISGDFFDLEAAATDLGEMMALLGEDLARLNHPGAPLSMQMPVIHRLAKAMEGPADDLAAAAERFAERVEASVAAFRTLLEWARSTPRSKWPDSVEGILEQLVRVPLEAQAAAATYQEVMVVIGLFSASSRQLRRPARRINAALRASLRVLSVLEELQGLAATLTEV